LLLVVVLFFVSLQVAGIDLVLCEQVPVYEVFTE
jgi:hypothetical protein